jgi:hypothetical protein
LLITGAATEIFVRSTYMMKAMRQSRMNVILALLRVGCEGDMSSSIRFYKAEVLRCAALLVKLQLMQRRARCCERVCRYAGA